MVSAATLALAGVLVYALWPGPNLREGSEPLEEVTVRIDVRAPSAYRIVYRVENLAGGDVTVSTETLLVRRPFEALSIRREGAARAGKDLGRTVNGVGRLKTDQVTLAIPPSPASLDRRPDAYLPETVEAGFAEAREARRVAGRRCRVFRTAGAAGAAGVEKVSEAKDSYTDVCVDEAGLVLEEVGVTDGKILLRRLATAVDESPDIPDGSFETGDPTLDVRQGGGAVRRLRRDSRPPGTYWEPPEAPEGFEHEGRYSVIPPQTGFDDPAQRQNLIAFTSDVWRSGIDVIIVEQGATLGGNAPFAEDPNGQDVDVGALGRGQVVYSSASAEVRVLLKGGRFVRVFGTVGPSRLLAMARSLEEREGGTLVFEDEGPS